MGDENEHDANFAPPLSNATGVAPASPARVSVVPRPVSIPPRPTSTVPRSVPAFAPRASLPPPLPAERRHENADLTEVVTSLTTTSAPWTTEKADAAAVTVVAPLPVAIAPLPGRQPPPPPSSRGLGSGVPRSLPPPPPQRSQSGGASATVLGGLNKSVLSRPSANPPPPPVRHYAVLAVPDVSATAPSAASQLSATVDDPDAWMPSPPTVAPGPAQDAFRHDAFKPEVPTTPSSLAPVASGRPSAAAPNALAQLEQRLGTAQVELRKLGSERHALRARLRRETDRVHELESALRAEKELRLQASDEHQAALAGLRARLGSLEPAEARASDLERKLSDALAALAAKDLELFAFAEARRVPEADPPRAGADARVGKALEGLRRVRGIGPGYQRALEGLGVTELRQVAAWTANDIETFAEKLKIRPDRITKDDWVGQAKRLTS